MARNMPDSATLIRVMSSARPSTPPMMKAFRQSYALAMMFARMAPETPTEATSIVP
jgi:hypothetical protein